jgi:DNA polymerase (family 10)
MALAAKKLGYEYLAITDHSVSTRVANGLDKKRLLTHLLAVRAAQKKLKGITLLAGSEVDIRPDGSLDYPAEILKQLDIVLISIHSNFKMTRDKMTRRIIKALENKYAQIFCHPTGRLINEREAYEVDMEALLQAAKKRGTIIELNANPRRLDLTDVYCQRAKELNIKIVISTDAHSTDQLSLMKYGVITARRGWLEKKNVINTLPLKQFLLQLASR